MANAGTWTPVFLLVVFSSFANGFVFFVIIKSGLLRSRQNVLVFSLVICDAIRSVLKFTELVYLLRHDSSDNEVACKVLGFFTTWSDLIGCSAIPMLFYDRLMFLSGPVNYLHRMTRLLVLAIIIYANLHALLLAVIPLSGWGSFTYYPEVSQCGIQLPEGLGYGIFRILFGYGISVVAASALFIRMAVIVNGKIKQTQVYNTMRSTPQPMGLHRAIAAGSITETDQAFVKTLRILLIMLLFYYISWLSHISVYIYMIAKEGKDLSLSAFIIRTLLSFTTCAANPFVYGLHNRRFRQTVKKIVTCGRIAESDIEDISTNPQKGIALLSSDHYKLRNKEPGRYQKTDGRTASVYGVDNPRQVADVSEIYLAVRPAWRPRDEEYRIDA